MRRVIGLDLNGWHDFACRDWSVDDPDEPAGALDIVDGGFGSVVVTHDGKTIGGPQAILSPIGRGNGWGRIGAAGKRRALADLWRDFLLADADSHSAGDFRAATDALSVQAEEIILCMPDHAAMAEARQQQLLGMLSGARRPRVTLLWRPVAVLLDVLEAGTLPGATDGMRIACAIHGPDGLEVQHLVVRRLPQHPDQMAPERGRSGQICCAELGLTPLLAHARDAVLAANPTLLERPTEASRLPLGLLFRESDLPAEEVVRRDNGNWVLLRTPSDFIMPDKACEPRPACAGADLLLVLTPLARRHHGWLARYLSVLGVPVLMTDPSGAARGALRAARRIGRGIPHYLDRLDQVSLAVLRPSGPVFEDLIPVNATVPGNREYVSPPITSMIWTADMTAAQFFIRKGGGEIRHWVTPAVTAPERNQRLEVQLRQMPAQGWAKLLVTAPDWEVLSRAPIRLDWASLKIDPRSADEILAELQGPRPVIPQRVHLAAHIGLWDGSLRQPGLRRALQTLDVGDPSALDQLADILSRSFTIGPSQRVFPVGTDGDLPDSLDAATHRQFLDAINRIAVRLLSDVSSRRAQPNNHALRCLTWTFALCHGDVKKELEAALGCSERHEWHPLLAPTASRRVVVHGLGRVTTERATLLKLIPHLSRNLGQPNCLAALSSLLSRPLETPGVLVELDVSALAESLIPVLRGLCMANTFGVDVKYALLSVAGLLRARERDPWALVADRSAQAKALIDLLLDVVAGIAACRRQVPAANAKLESARALIDLLSGTGGRPDILSVVDEMPDA